MSIPRSSDIPVDSVQLLVSDRPDGVAAGGDLIVERFERIARISPDAIAVEVIADGEEAFEQHLSYHQLNALANRIAGLLRRHGTAPEHVVAVAADHDLATVAAIVGVLKTGACFLPLDAAMPRARVNRIIQESRLCGIVVTTASRNRYEGCDVPLVAIDECLASGDSPAGERSTEVHGANAAYVIYTSGSSGEPKGVVVTHEGLANHGASVSRILDLTPKDTVLQFASLAFDAAYEEVFPCLCSGARLAVRSTAMTQDIGLLLRRCEERAVTFLDIPTALLPLLTRILREGEELPGSLRAIVIGGEAAAAADIAYWIENHGCQVELLNTYGPTEGTIITTYCELMAHGLAGEEVPLGECLPCTSIALRMAGRTCPPGEMGEIHIAGVGVARGYLQAPRLTAERFVPDPDTRWGGREYRTGDLAVRTQRGDLVFKGRHDHQIKLNGHRIQLEEVEAAVLSHPSIGACAVLLRDNRTGGKQLVAYCVLDDKQTSLPFEVAPLSVMELRAFLRDLLPEYMMPAEFSFLERFILNSNGKIDRTKLPEIGHFDRSHRQLPGHECPRPGIEMALARVWCEVLDLDLKELSACDPFEFLGGNSLYSIQVRHKAQKAGLLFKASAMHFRQTIRGLAECCEVSDGVWKRTRHACEDYAKYLRGVGTVLLRQTSRALEFRRIREERRQVRTVRRFYDTLTNKHDIFYVYITTNLLHWVWTTLRFVPADVNIVLIGAGLTDGEIAWVRRRINRPFVHLGEMLRTDRVVDILFEVNTRNFGWLDPDCFIMNPSLFTEIRQMAPDVAMNCVWTHAACGPTKRPFHVIEGYFLFFNISVIETLRREGLLPRPSARYATLSQARVMRKMIPADARQPQRYSSAFTHRMFAFDFERLVLFQLVANARGFKLNRVRFFTEIDTFNPYNYFSDEAIHVFPTIRHYTAYDPSGGEQHYRLMPDYLLMTSLLHELPPEYESRREFIEGQLRAGLGLIPLDSMRTAVRQYLAERGVTDKTFKREEFAWLAC